MTAFSDCNVSMRDGIPFEISTFDAYIRNNIAADCLITGLLKQLEVYCLDESRSASSQTLLHQSKKGVEFVRDERKESVI